MSLSGKIALVTGAAHRVGRGIALALAREGAHLVLHYGRSAEAAQQTAVEVAALGVETLPVQADLAQPAAIERLFNTIRGRFGQLDVLVNSAASFERRPFDHITVSEWDAVLAVNLRAPFLCMQQAARLMHAGAGGAIVNIADLSGMHPWVEFAHHAASKAALIHLTRVAARELAPAIRVNAIVPGPILPPPGVSVDDAGWQAAIDRVPLRRAGSPEAVGQAVVYLAQSDFVTGQVLAVDGGEGLLGPAGH